MQTGEGMVRSGGPWQDEGVLRRSGRGARAENPALSAACLGMYFLLAPPFLPTATSASQHSPGSAHKPSGDHSGLEPRALLLVHRKCWLQGKGAEGIWGLVSKGLGNKDVEGGVPARKLLGSISFASRLWFVLLARQEYRFLFSGSPNPILFPRSSHAPLLRRPQKLPQHGAPEVTSLTPRLSPGRMVPITHLAEVGRLPG